MVVKSAEVSSMSLAYMQQTLLIAFSEAMVYNVYISA